MSDQRGFTLIEVIVSVGIFGIAATISMGALLSMSNANKEAQKARAIVDNINFALENMTREMRLGFNYHCDATVAPTTAPRDCPAGATSIAVRDTTDTQTIVYAYDAAAKTITKGGLPLTSSEIQVDQMKFYVSGAGNDNNPPQILITLSASAQVGNKKITDFRLQTMITQRRVLDAND